MSINSPQLGPIKQEPSSSSTDQPASAVGLSTSREKRIRKQKQYDSDFLLYDNANNCIEMKLNELETPEAATTTPPSANTSGTDCTKYQVGDLVWAKVSGHPWWPCIVSRDSTGSHVKEVGTSRPKRHFYVEFFGPAVEHAWVAEGGLIEYKGIEAFKTYAQDQVDQAPTKSAKEKLAERFQLKVALTRRDHWETGVEEADEALTKKRADDRMLIIMRKKSTDENEENVTPVSRAKSGEKTMQAQTQQQQESRAVRSRTRLSLEVPKVPAGSGVANKRKRVASVANSDEMALSQSSSAAKLKRTDSANDESIIDDDDDDDDESDTFYDSTPSPITKPTTHELHQTHLDDDQIYLDDNESTIIELCAQSNPIACTIATDESCSASSDHIIETFQPRTFAESGGSDTETSELINETKRHEFTNDYECDDIESSSPPPHGTGPGATETYLIDRYKYAVRHIKQGLSVEEACNKYRISKGALLKCLSGGTAPRGKKTRLTEIEENGVVEWLISNQNLKYNEAIHLVFQQVVSIFERANRPNPFHNGKPSMDWWYDFLSRHPQIMASKPDWMMRGKVNDQYIRDVQSGRLKCTKFRRALLSAIQYIKSSGSALGVGEACDAPVGPVTTIVTAQEPVMCQQRIASAPGELSFMDELALVDSIDGDLDGAGSDGDYYSPPIRGANGSAGGSNVFISQMIDTSASGGNKTLFAMMRSHVYDDDELDLHEAFLGHHHLIDPSTFLP